MLRGDDRGALGRRGRDEMSAGDQPLAVDGWVLGEEALLAGSVKAELTHTFEPLAPGPSLCFHDRPAVDLLEAVRIEREPNDLIDEPLALTTGELGPQLLFEGRDELTVDGLDDGFDGGHVFPPRSDSAAHHCARGCFAVERDTIA